MRTDVKVLELSSGSLRPGYLLSKLQGARTQAQKLGDAILIGNVDAELKEMKTMVEVVGIWKKVKALDQLLKKNWPQFLESMDKLRRHKALVAVIPWTAVANEQSVKACEAIEAGREGEGLSFLHIGNLKTHSPSLKLCTPTDLEDLQMRMVRDMLSTGLTRSTFVVGLDEKGTVLNILFDHTGHDTQAGGPFFSSTVAMICLDIRQVAMAKTLSPADQGTDNDLEHSLQRFHSVSEKAYEIFRDHRQTGEKLLDRAIVSLEESRANDRLQEIQNDILKEIMVFAEQVKEFAPSIGNLVEVTGRMCMKKEGEQLDLHEARACAIVESGHEILKKLENPELLARGVQQRVDGLRQSFGNAWRPMVSEFANTVKCVLLCRVYCLSQTAATDDPGEQALDLVMLKAYYSEMKEATESELHVITDQWSVLVEPFLHDIVAADNASEEKLLIPPSAFMVWATSLRDVIVNAGLFWSALEEVPDELVPLPLGQVGEQESAGVKTALSTAPRSEATRVCYANLSRSVAKLVAAVQMKQSQQRAYDMWLGHTMMSAISLALHWCKGDASAMSGVLQAAIDDLKQHCVPNSVSSIVTELNKAVDSRPGPIVALAKFEQPKERGRIAHDIALSGQQAQTGVIEFFMAFSHLKQLLVQLHISVEAAGARLDVLVHCIKDGDVFKNACDDIFQLLTHGSVDDKDEHLDELKKAKSHIHGILSKTYVELLSQHVDGQLVSQLPSDYNDIVSSQVHASIRSVMFTKRRMDLVERIDETEVLVKAFKGSQLLHIASGDDQFIGKWSMVRSQMQKATQFSLTWEACDLLLNKFPKATTVASRAAQFREFSGNICWVGRRVWVGLWLVVIVCGVSGSECVCVCVPMELLRGVCCCHCCCLLQCNSHIQSVVFQGLTKFSRRPRTLQSRTISSSGSM